MPLELSKLSDTSAADTDSVRPDVSLEDGSLIRHKLYGSSDSWTRMSTPGHSVFSPIDSLDSDGSDKVTTQRTTQSKVRRSSNSKVPLPLVYSIDSDESHNQTSQSEDLISKNEYSLLLKLPGELRNHIYKEVLKECPKVINLFADRTKYSKKHWAHLVPYDPNRYPFIKCLPGIAYASIRVYFEYASLYAARTTFEVKTVFDLWYLQDFLDAFPNNSGWNTLKSLDFTAYTSLACSHARAVEVMDFIHNAPHLEHLTLAIMIDQLHLPPLTPSDNNELAIDGPSHTAHIFAKKFGLDGIPRMPHLKRLIIKCVNDGRGLSTGDVSVFGDLLKYLTDAFKSDSRVESVRLGKMDFPRQNLQISTHRIVRRKGMLLNV